MNDVKIELYNDHFENAKRYVKYRVYIAENLWYGISITKKTDIHMFNFLPAGCNTFVSFEPILENLKIQECSIIFRMTDWFIIGAETGNRKDKVIPRKEWIDSICKAADEAHIPVFMKDSLIPIVGEENMKREFPWTTN